MNPFNRMASIILEFEARRDTDGDLAVYKLPSGDGGGTFEVAGINDRYHPREAHTLAWLIEHQLADVAERFAVLIILEYTQVVCTWNDNLPLGTEFYLRDCVFNRGPRGAAMILQRALGVRYDGVVGPITKAALETAAGNPLELAHKLDGAREWYERAFAHRDESSKFWNGLVNRWSKARAAADEFGYDRLGNQGMTQHAASETVLDRGPIRDNGVRSDNEGSCCGGTPKTA